MTRSFRRLTIVQLLWVLGACHDDGEPSRPTPTSPVFPVVGAEAGRPAAADMGHEAGPAQGVTAPADPPGADSGSAPVRPDQLPCDVASFLSARCLNCHGSPPLPGIPMSLATYADLTLRSRTYPDQTHAQRALLRMQMGSMPPGGGLSAAEVQLFATWVMGGAQPGTCGSGELDAGPGASDGGTPMDAGVVLDAGHDAAPPHGGAPEAGARDASADSNAADSNAADASSAADAGTSDASPPNGCSSGVHWDGGTRGSPLMTPGQACLSCHASTAPLFSFAGTIFPGAHEPDDCFGAIGNGVSIVITGANGQRLSITPNAAGNFIAGAGVPLPYTLEVAYQGRKRVKTQPQMSGDCNGCHSQQGSNGATGRVTLP